MKNVIPAKAGIRSVPENRKKPAANLVLRFSAAFGIALLSALAAKKASAQQHVNLDDGINNITVVIPPDSDATPRAVGAQLRHGARQNEFWMTFSALQRDLTLGGTKDIYRVACEIDDGPENSIIFRRRSSVPSVPGYNNPGENEETLLQIDRGDGVLINIKPDIDIFIDGVNRWTFDGTCPNTGVVSANPAVDGRLKLLAGVSSVGGLDADVCYIDEPEWYTSLNLCVEAGTDGVVDIYESDAARDEVDAPEAYVDDEYGDLLAVTRSNDPFPGTERFWMRRPPGGGFENWENPLQHLDFDETDGTLVSEDPQMANPDSIGRVWSMLPNSREFPLMTPSGRSIVLVVHRGVNTETGGAILRASAFEKDPTTGLLKNIPISTEVAEGVIDSDNDGRPDETDGCDLRANAGGVDVAGGMSEGIRIPNGTEDACEPGNDCRGLGEFPIVSPAGLTNSSGLRLCRSGLGYGNGTAENPGAFAFGDGSLAHSDENVDLNETGDMMVRPGQEIRFAHAPDPREPRPEDPLPSGNFRTPSDSGNSVHLEVYDTTRPDGTTGEFSFSYHPIDDPFGTPVTISVNVDPREGDAPFIWDSPGVIVGGESAAEGTDYLVRLGAEEEPLPCDTPCECSGPCDPDAGPGTPDAGADSGTDGSTDEDAPAEQPDSGSDAPADQPDAGADAPVLQPDAAMADMMTDREDANKNRADAGADDGGKTPKPDSPEPPTYSDSGPIRTDMGSDPTQPGCGACNLGKSPENKDTPLGPLAILGVAGVGLGLENRRRRTQQAVREAVKVAD